MKLRPALFFVLCLFCRYAYTQCPPAASFLSGLKELEEAPAPLRDKITRLQQLTERHARCFTNHDSVYARLVHRLGNLYSQDGQMEKALVFTREAIRINAARNRFAEEKYLAHSYFNLGLIYKELYRLPQSHLYFDSSIYWATRYSEKQFIALMACEQKAYAFYQTGDYSKSIEIAGTGIAIARLAADRLSEGVLLSQRAQAAAALNRLGPAEDDIREALGALTGDAAEPAALATAYAIYGAILTQRKQPSKAVAFYRKAIAMNEQEKNWQQCSRNLLDLGYLYDRDLGDAGNALRCYEKGIGYLQQQPDAYQLSGLYNNIGVVHWRQKNYRKALQYYQKGLMALPVNFRDAAWSRNPPPQSLKTVANDYFVSTLLANKGEALLLQFKQNNEPLYLRHALLAFEAADHSVDMMRWKQSAEESKLHWRQRTEKLYQQAIETCLALNDARRAFYFFEKSRAVLLNDRLSELGARQLLPPAEQQKELDLQNQLQLLQRQLSTTAETSKAYSGLSQQLLAKQREWENFIARLETNNPAYYQYKYNTAVPTVEQVQQYLASNRQSLIEYVHHDSAIYILAITPSQITLRKLADSRLQENIAAFRRICANPALLNQDYASYRSLAYRLYQSLFQPLAIPTERVVVSPGGEFIPFDALLASPQVPEHFLLTDHAFSYTYSAGWMLKTGLANKQPAAPSFLGFAPVEYAKHLKLATLPGADESLQELKDYFSPARVFTGEKASRRELLARFSQFQIVHLYSHAEAGEAGREPVLYLADSALYLSEIQQLAPVQTTMVVLSACNTGVGLQAKGEGVFSLSRAFAATGVPCTVTSLWQIDNKATYRLSELFYDYLNQAFPRDVSLQKAKMQYVKESSQQHRLPYFWAATVLIGKTDSIRNVKDLPAASPTIIFAIAAGLLLVGLLWLFAIRRSRHRGKSSDFR